MRFSKLESAANEVGMGAEKVVGCNRLQQLGCDPCDARDKNAR